MQAFSSRLVLSTGFFGLVLGLAPGDDTKPDPADTPKPATVDKVKAPDFTGYQWVTLMTAEVVKADDSKVTMRVFWQHVTTTNGNKGARPSLHGNHGRSHHSPFATRRPNTQVKWEHHDYEVPFLAESLVRNKQLPPKIGPDGKRGYYSAKEQDDLQVPYAVPGFQATKADLVPGTIIEAHIVRDKTIPANKVADGDMRIKYAVILRHDPNPPKDIVAPPTPKKN